MRWILCFTMFVSLGFAPAPVYKAKPKPIKKDLDLLQGTWVVVRATSDNKPVREHEGVCLVVRGSVIEIRHKQSSSDQYRFEIDETKKERTLKLQTEGETDPAKKPWLGLYRLVGDNLTLCTGEKRGEAVTSIEGGLGLLHLVLERSPKP